MSVNICQSVSLFYAHFVLDFFFFCKQFQSHSIYEIGEIVRGQLSLGQSSEGQLSGGNDSGQSSGRQLSGGQLSGGQFSSGATVRTPILFSRNLFIKSKFFYEIKI